MRVVSQIKDLFRSNKSIAMVIAFVTMIALTAIPALLLMVLWNYSMPQAVGAGELDLLQAWCLMLLVMLATGLVRISLKYIKD